MGATRREDTAAPDAPRWAVDLAAACDALDPPAALHVAGRPLGRLAGVVPPLAWRLARAALVEGVPRVVAAVPGPFIAGGLDGPLPALLVQPLARRGHAGPAWRGLAAARERLAAALAEAAAGDAFLPLVAASPGLAPLAASLGRLAPTPLPLLLQGATGTGKELVARAVHAVSGRPGPLVAENCAALPETLLEAELFGVRRGAFTGSADRRGRVAEAHGGTLFLDEVADLPLALQAKLLRVLQDHEVRALGADRAHRVNVRVLAATHRPLAELAAAGQFRADLFYRIAGATLVLPALLERRDDLPFLVAALLARLAAEGLGPGRHLAPGALAVLEARPFPGNVRELDHVLRQAAALAPGALVPPGLLAPAAAAASVTPPDNLEVRMVSAAVAAADGNKAVAARRLGWSRQKLYRRLIALGLAGTRGRRPL